MKAKFRKKTCLKIIELIELLSLKESWRHTQQRKIEEMKNFKL